MWVFQQVNSLKNVCLILQILLNFQTFFENILFWILILFFFFFKVQYCLYYFFRKLWKRSTVIKYYKSTIVRQVGCSSRIKDSRENRSDAAGNETIFVSMSWQKIAKFSIKTFFDAFRCIVYFSPFQLFPWEIFSKISYDPKKNRNRNLDPARERCAISSFILL